MFIIPLLGYNLCNFKAKLTSSFATFPKGGKVTLIALGTILCGEQSCRKRSSYHGHERHVSEALKWKKNVNQ